MPALVKYGHSSPGFATDTAIDAAGSGVSPAASWNVTAYRPSAWPAVTVTGALAVLVPPTCSVPLVGLTDTPSLAVAVQVTVSGLAVMLVTLTDAAADSPGAMISPAPGLVEVNALRWPVPSDGGAASWPAAQEVFGLEPRAKSSLPPLARSPKSTQAFCQFLPFTLRLWTYGVSSAASGALMVSVLPPARCRAAFWKTGLPNTSVGVPGVSGYMPSSDQTYQELMAPRSSLPNWPTGASKYSCCWAWRTTCWVFHGLPT